jgi:hypothetical protein
VPGSGWRGPLFIKLYRRSGCVPEAALVTLVVHVRSQKKLGSPIHS